MGRARGTQFRARPVQVRCLRHPIRRCLLAVFLISLQLAFGVFGPNPVSDLIQGIIAYLPNLFAAVVILVIVAALAKVVTDLLAAALGEVSVANGSPVWQEWPSWSSGSSRP